MMQIQAWAKSSIWEYQVPNVTNRMNLFFRSKLMNHLVKYGKISALVVKDLGEMAYKFFNHYFTHVSKVHSRPENLKKSRKKNSWNQINQKKIREIAFLAVFPVQKLIFGHFWNSKKWNLVNWFIWFHEFKGLDVY